MKMGIPCLALLVLVFVHVDGRNRVALPTDGNEGQLPLLSDKDPIIEYPFSQKETLQSDPLQENYLCKSCLDVSKYVEAILTDSKSSDIVGLLSEVCHFLPADAEEKCLDRVKTYTEDAIKFLKKKFSDENLCYNTGFCAENAKELSFLSSGIDETPTFKLYDGISCTTCHNATDEFLNMLEDPETNIKLIKALLKSCEKVEIHVKQCKRMVFEYGPLVLAKLEKYMRSNDICNLLNFCPEVGVQMMEE